MVDDDEPPVKDCYFKAFKENNVWCTDSQIYQASDSVSELIEDFHVLVTDEDAGEMSFLKKLD